jgi:hypothetical protein
MNSSPFARSPDSFWLKLQQRPAGFEVRPFESPFGETDEALCYFMGTLVGLTHNQGTSSELLVSLLPTLDAKRAYLWPSAEQFEIALASLLDQARGWSLTSERDTDQEHVRVLDSRTALRRELSKVIAFCKGAAAACPTFHVEAEALDA